MDASIIEKIKTLADRAGAFLKFDKVVLYGSYSDDTNTSISDIDVAFFVSEISPNHWELSAKLFELVDGIDNRIEPIIIKESSDPSGFAHKILERGILVC